VNTCADFLKRVINKFNVRIFVDLRTSIDVLSDAILDHTVSVVPERGDTRTVFFCDSLTEQFLITPEHAAGRFASPASCIFALFFRDCFMLTLNVLGTRTEASPHFTQANL
jgi:hypothetical protein